MNFLERLEIIIEQCITLNLGLWISDGKIFHVYDLNILENTIKPYTVSTLKRQLNYYGFKMTHVNGFTFYHPNFTRDIKIPIIRNAQSLHNEKLKEACRKRDREYRERKAKEKAKAKAKEKESIFPPSPPQFPPPPLYATSSAAEASIINLLDNRIDNISKRLKIITSEIKQLVQLQTEKLNKLQTEKELELMFGEIPENPDNILSVNTYSRCVSPISIPEFSRVIDELVDGH